MKTKTCPVCGQSVKGRQDKLFCSAKCRNAQYYEKRQDNEAFYFTVDKQLKTNRKLLKRYNRDGFTTLRQERLSKEGFDPAYFTHYWKNQKGQVYLFCYEFGFLALKENGKEKYLLVTWQDYMKKK